MNKENLKLRPTVSTCGTYYYETAKFLASYLMPFTKNESKIKNTTEFSERLNSCSLNDQEIAVSYDVSSLFTEVPLDETINDIVEEIYTRNKLCKLDPKHLFKWLLCNVTKNTVYPLSPVFANIFMAKLEEDKVLPYNLPFYDHNVDDCFSNKVENEPDRLFERLNNYRHHIKFTVEEKPIGETKEKTQQYKRQNTRRSLTTPHQPITSQNIQHTHTHKTSRAQRKPPFERK